MSNSSIYEKFSKKKKRKNIVTAFMLFVFILCMLIANDLEQVPPFVRDLMVPVLTILLIVFIVFMLVNWRCPRCNAYLGREMTPKYCPHCGVQLVEYID